MKVDLMGVTKSNLFSSDHNELARLAQAIAHPARIAIVEYLRQVKSCLNRDLVDQVGLAQPTISQHLTTLKNAGLVLGTIEGSSMCYVLDDDRWNEVSGYFGHFFQKKKVPKCGLNEFE